jgi:hypothetical protein
MSSLADQIRQLLRVKPQAEGHQKQLSLEETDNTLLVGAWQAGESQRDRLAYDREQVLADCMDAWRFNPLARRITELTTTYVTGGGFVLSCPHAATQAFLERFWNHRLNHLSLRAGELSDELVLSGNLFLLLSTDASGMSYLRVIPSADIARIESSQTDIEQELFYVGKPGLDGDERIYPAYQPGRDRPGEGGAFSPVMLHYAVNRPVGSQWGESDLAPVLKWLSRYSAWLEDRVRLNRFRNAFVYVVRARFANESARLNRQAQLALHPPAPGSVLVTDENEEWSVIAPKLEALDASSDVLAIKKMIAAGVGLPLHFLAEPESSTKTTAEASGNPTYRRFAERQRAMCWFLQDLLRVAVERRAYFDPGVDPAAQISVSGGDISARDNAELADAGQKAAAIALSLHEKGLISSEEMLRLVYRFMGEQLPAVANNQSEQA